MTDKKISELTSLTGANVSDANDVVAIVDSDQNTTKKITRAEFFKNVSSVDINGGTIDGVTIGGASAGAATFTDVTASGTINFSGATVSNGGSVTTVDINGGTIDGTVIGGASAAAGTFTSADLAAIADTKAVTAVDVFVYDTSKDSDGGAWRKRTQHTSWYNETLNTATRGSRREFPAVAVIVAESNKVTIYDGDDPALPMWMVFNGVSTNAISSTLITSLSAANGIISVGTNAATGMFALEFLKDRSFRYNSLTITTGYYNGTLLDRNATKNFTYGFSLAIVNANVNSVAMTVLPDAPVDPATGLPVPTIAVATAGGVSVIKDDGTVVDLTRIISGSVNSARVAFLKDGGIAWSSRDVSRYIQVLNAIPDADYAGDPDRLYSEGDQPAAGTDLYLLNLYASKHLVDGASGGHDGVTFLDERPDAPEKGMVAYTTSTYNTGWMNGDIKLATLSDTDDTDVTASVPFSDDMSSDTTANWSGFYDSLTFSTDHFNMQRSSVDGRASAEITGLVSGKTYVITADVQAVGGNQSVKIGVTNGAYAQTELTTWTATTSGYTTISHTYTHGSMTRAVIWNATTSSNVNWKNWSIRLAEEDRSVNGNGLQVFGTVTKNPVNSGSDLVGYSGFSASNYLMQPYNPDYQFGTGDFAIIGWIKEAANSAVETILERDSATTAQRFTLAVDASGFLTFTCDDDTTARTATSTIAIDNGTWTHFVATYDGAGGLRIYLNGALNDTETGAALLTLNNAAAVLRVGLAVDDAEPLTNGNLALLRISATAPTADQIRKIYEDEKVLFQENAQATLYGASDAVTALAHDPVTDLLHVGTSAGRSVFSGLRRVSNTTTAVGTAISAQAGLVVEE